MDPSQGFDFQQAAYFMWEADGRPQACGDRYWHEAVALEDLRRERAAAKALWSLEQPPSVDKPSMGHEPGTADPPMAVPEPATVEAEATRQADRRPDAPPAPFDGAFGWFDLAQAQIRCAVTGLSRLTACRTFGEIAASQNDTVRQSMRLAVEHGLRMVARVQDVIDNRHP